MNNKNYWINRSRNELKSVAKSALEVENRTKRLYMDLLKDYIKRYEKLMSPLCKNGVLDVGELRKKMTYDKTFIYKMKDLEIRISQIAETLEKSQVAEFSELMEKVYKLGYEKTMEGLQMAPKRAVENLLKKPILGESYSDRIWKDKSKLVRGMRDVLSKSVQNGQQIDVTSKQFAQKMGVSLSNSKRLIRTETIANYNNANLDAYKDCGVEYLEVIDTEDSRTCDICNGHDGDKVPVDKATVGVNIPVWHPNCRCCTIPVIK